MLLASLGSDRNDETIALLQKAYAEHSNVVMVIDVAPEYDRLRGDSRFQELLRRLNFKQ